MLTPRMVTVRGCHLRGGGVGGGGGVKMGGWKREGEEGGERYVGVFEWNVGVSYREVLFVTASAFSPTDCDDCANGVSSPSLACTRHREIDLELCDEIVSWYGLGTLLLAGNHTARLVCGPGG